VKVWRAHWAEFTPFLAFPPEVRRVTYTTNLIESMNARLRKVTRNRGEFASEQAALKVLYLAVRNLQHYPGPNTGIRSSGSKQALQAFTIYFDGRIPTPGDAGLGSISRATSFLAAIRDLTLCRGSRSRYRHGDCAAAGPERSRHPDTAASRRLSMIAAAGI
jgi:hypothetical protein